MFAINEKKSFSLHRSFSSCQNQGEKVEKGKNFSFSVSSTELRWFSFWDGIKKKRDYSSAYFPLKKPSQALNWREREENQFTETRTVSMNRTQWPAENPRHTLFYCSRLEGLSQGANARFSSPILTCSRGQLKNSHFYNCYLHLKIGRMSGNK